VTYVPTPIADPAPLGLAGFAATTFIVGMFFTGLVGSIGPGGGTNVILGMALAYGGIAQLLAGMWEFRRGNTFGAVAFTSYGAFWLSFWALNHFFLRGVGGIAAKEVGPALGLYLITWGIFTAYMFVASLRTTAVIALVLATLTAAFIILGIGWSSISVSKLATGVPSGTMKLGGWFALASAVLAWYASFASVANETFGKDLVPTWPLARR
jgi:succinate-acetate transporter protein